MNAAQFAKLETVKCPECGAVLNAQDHAALLAHIETHPEAARKAKLEAGLDVLADVLEDSGIIQVHRGQ